MADGNFIAINEVARVLAMKKFSDRTGRRKAGLYKVASFDKTIKLEKQRRLTLLPDRHGNKDFFLADILDYALKDDGVSMEAPIFTLSTKPDLSSWTWKSQDGNKFVEVYPSIKGRATQFDKDILIYIISKMTAGLNQKREDAKSRTVRFVVHDYLIATNKPTGGNQYERLEFAFDRLSGTRIKTDIQTGEQRVREGFGIIDSWTVIEKSPNNEKMIAVEVTLSKWLYNAVQANEVLTIHKDYFRLRKPLERRVYELVRKHCGVKEKWQINLDLLRVKSGSKQDLKHFKADLKKIIFSKVIPEYIVKMDDEDMIIFENKNHKKDNFE